MTLPWTKMHQLPPKRWYPLTKWQRVLLQKILDMNIWHLSKLSSSDTEHLSLHDLYSQLRTALHKLCALLITGWLLLSASKSEPMIITSWPWTYSCITCTLQSIWFSVISLFILSHFLFPLWSRIFFVHCISHSSSSASCNQKTTTQVQLKLTLTFSVHCGMKELLYTFVSMI